MGKAGRIEHVIYLDLSFETRIRQVDTLSTPNSSGFNSSLALTGLGYIKQSFCSLVNLDEERDELIINIFSSITYLTSLAQYCDTVFHLLNTRCLHVSKAVPFPFI